MPGLRCSMKKDQVPQPQGSNSGPMHRELRVLATGSKVKVGQSCPTLQPHGLYSLWNSPGQNTGVGSLSLLQGIFPTQGLNPGLPHWWQILYQLSHKRSPRTLEWIAYPFSRGSSRPRNQTRVSCRFFGRFFTNWGIREAPLATGPTGKASGLFLKKQLGHISYLLFKNPVSWELSFRIYAWPWSSPIQLGFLDPEGPSTWIFLPWHILFPQPGTLFQFYLPIRTPPQTTTTSSLCSRKYQGPADTEF